MGGGEICCYLELGGEVSGVVLEEGVWNGFDFWVGALGKWVEIYVVFEGEIWYYYLTF